MRGLLFAFPLYITQYKGFNIPLNIVDGVKFIKDHLIRLAIKLNDHSTNVFFLIFVCIFVLLPDTHNAPLF